MNTLPTNRLTALMVNKFLKTIKISKLTKKKEDWEDFFEENNVQNINSTFQTTNSLNQRSLEIS